MLPVLVVPTHPWVDPPPGVLKLLKLVLPHALFFETEECSLKIRPSGMLGFPQSEENRQEEAILRRADCADFA